ncbi:unnamed protein product, partial [Ectocarpus sp. 4 AP-2014]
MQVSARTIISSSSSSSSRKRSTITSNAAHWVMLSLQQVHNMYSTGGGNNTTNHVRSQQAPHRVQVPTSSNARRLIRSAAARLHAPAPKAGFPPLLSLDEPALGMIQWEPDHRRALNSHRTREKQPSQNTHTREFGMHKTYANTRPDDTYHKRKKNKHTNNTDSQLIILIFRVYSV